MGEVLIGCKFLEFKKGILGGLFLTSRSPLLGIISEHFGANNGYMALLLPLVILLGFSIFVLKRHDTQQKISDTLIF